MKKLVFEIEHHSELDSTNALAMTYGADGKPEGLVVRADYQTRGRGRGGHNWLSRPGTNLLFSVLLRPPITPAAAPILTQKTCQAVRTVLEKTCGLQCSIKPPNDLLIDKKKICGILVESSSQSQNRLDYAVIGIGLNVAHAPEGLETPATCLQNETKKIWDPVQLLDEVLHALRNELGEWYDHPS